MVRYQNIGRSFVGSYGRTTSSDIQNNDISLDYDGSRILADIDYFNLQVKIVRLR